MAKIRIAKIAYGSLSTSIGDGTIGYTSGVSDRAREVDGRYVDIPPVLSKEYSTLIWRYYKDTDNYMLTHVQGSQVEDGAMGRVFSYRGAYEVSRTELNRTGWSVANIMSSMPRIRLYAHSEVWADETDYVKHKNRGDNDVVVGLRQLISYAIDSGKRLFISIPSKGRGLQCNGTFDSFEWSTLLEAVDSMDLSMRRYVSFAFCADQNYAKYLDEVLVTVYPRESKFVVPEGNIDCEWNQIKAIPGADAKLKDTITIMRTMPGESDKMLSIGEMQDRLQKMKESLVLARSKRHADFDADDYAIWLVDGHTPSELSVDNWTDMERIMTLVGDDEKARKAVVATHRNNVAKWSAEGLTAEYIKLFGMQNSLDGSWILANRNVIEPDPMKWYDMFKAASLLKKDGVVDAFRQMFSALLKKDFDVCSKAADFYSWTEKYRNIYDAEDISNLIATLELKSKKILIEEILDLNTRNAVGKVVKAGLNASASKVAREQGADLEKWMKLLLSLKDKEGNALLKVRTLCLSQVLEWDEAEKQEFARNAQRYSSEHPKMAQNDRFQLIVKVLKSIMDKDIKIVNQPKSPSNNMQEKNGKTNNVAEGIGNDTLDIDSLYDQVIESERKGKNKKTIVCSLLSFILGMLVAGLLAYIFMPKEPVPQEPIPVVTDTLKVDSLKSDSLRADSLLKDSLRLDSIRKDSIQKHSVSNTKKKKK